jgi:hypothetical protein
MSFNHTAIISISYTTLQSLDALDFDIVCSVWLVPLTDVHVFQHRNTALCCNPSFLRLLKYCIAMNRSNVHSYSYLKAVPLQARTGPEGFRFQDNRHMKMVRLSALCTGSLYPPGNIPGTHFC